MTYRKWVMLNIVRLTAGRCAPARVFGSAMLVVAVLGSSAPMPAYATTHTWSPAPEPLIRKVADRVLDDFPEPPPFDWGEGVLMAGMMQAGVALNQPQYVEFVRRWADHWRTQGIRPLMAERGYCGHWGPGLPLLMLYEKTADLRYLDMARQIIEFIQKKGTFTQDGFPGNETGHRQIWLDTLFMCCPVYVRAAWPTCRPGLIDDAAKLLEVCASHGQDEKTGLFWHMYDEPSARRVGVLWARGNGWTAMSYVQVLRCLDPRSPAYPVLSRQFQRLVTGLLAAQDRSTGRWHTILDQPETYLETSATAMFLYSLVQAERAGLMRGHDPGLLERAWSGLAASVDGQGHVGDVSGGTDATDKRDVYANKPRGTYTWGTGAFLLAATSLKADMCGPPTDTPGAVLRQIPELRLPGVYVPEKGWDGYADCNNPVHWDGDTMYIFSSASFPFRSSGPDLEHLARPSTRVPFDNDKGWTGGGRWIEATFKHEGGTLYGWYHNEPPDICGRRHMTAPRIGACVSSDNGMTWNDLGFVLEAPPDALRCDTVNEYFVGGNGDFSVILDRGKEYFYFLIDTYHKDVAEQGVSIARLRYADRDNPIGKVWKWHKGAWAEPGLAGHVTPVFKVMTDWHDANADTFWGPAIHWNTYLERYVVLLNRAKDKKWTQDAIYISFNPDVANPGGWTTPRWIKDKVQFYPQVIGIDRGKHETDKLAGRVARFFVSAKSKWEIVFLKPGEYPPATQPAASPPAR